MDTVCLAKSDINFYITFAIYFILYLNNAKSFQQALSFQR